MGRGSGRGAESYERKKAWSFINNSILSGCDNSQSSPIAIAVTDSAFYCIWFIVTPPWLVLGGSDTQWWCCPWKVEHLCHCLCQVDDMGWNENEKGDFSVFFFFYILYVIQHCFICCPSDSTVSEDAGTEPRTVDTLALTARRSNHSDRSHPSRLDLIQQKVLHLFLREGSKLRSKISCAIPVP